MSNLDTEPSSESVTRWGIVATGRIAHSFARDLRVVPGAELAAVASRTPENARAFAAEFGPTARLYADAAALAADPDVDVVYIASPHTLHREQTLIALAAGKPVLCEKPLTMNQVEAEELFAAADGVFLMEAMWMACNPVVRAVREQLLAGRFGTPRQVHADLGFRVDESATARMTDPALGAGALLDMGIYPLTFAELMLGPAEQAVAVADLRDGVDWDIAISTRHAGGGLGALTASMTSHSPRAATVATSEGLVEFPQSFHHPAHAVWHPAGGEPERIEGIEPLLGSGLGNEAAHVQQCLAAGLTESPLVPKSQTLRLLSLMDRIRDQVGVRYAADA